MDELLPVGLLQFARVLGIIAPFPIEIGNFIRRTQMGGGIAMAIQAEKDMVKGFGLTLPRPSC